MIVYDLRCENGHMFEGWFKDSGAFLDQRERKLISCPACGAVSNEIAPASVMYIGKESSFPRSHEKKPETRSLQEFYNLLKNSIEHLFENAGERFTERAVIFTWGWKQREISGE